MKRSIRIITLFLALTAFALMAVGSGSSSSNDKKSTPEPAAVSTKSTPHPSNTPETAAPVNADSSANYSLSLKIRSDDNLMFSTYDITISLDSTEIGSVANGKTFEYSSTVFGGEHTLVFCKSGESSPKCSKTIVISEDTFYSCDLKHGSASIEIKNEKTGGSDLPVQPYPSNDPAPTKESGPQKVGIGERFGNKTISGIVTYADLDYKNINDVWAQIPAGKKAVFVKIKVTNISAKSNYVSVGDFDCYVDGISVDSELISGASEDYNANIAAGRSAILGALYIVPADSKNIELEYNPIGESSDRTIIVISDENTTGTILEAPEGADSLNVDKTNIKVIGIGEEFSNKTITGLVQDVNLDFKNTNDLWTQIPAGKKAILVTIKVTNISDKSNYVSVGDFDCYIDDISTDAELISGTDLDYNANIAAGRSALLGACYIIPADAKSIEMEYKPIGESAERTIIKIQ